MGIKVALIAPAGGGKDFIADYLVKEYGFSRYAFADKVKDVAKQWFPDLYKADKKPRALLQSIGTDFRKVDPDVWIKAMFEDIDKEALDRKKMGCAKENVVVTDCRMPNEYRALKERGFIFIKIEVNDNIRLSRMIERGDDFNVEDLQHHTESFYETFECDYGLGNHGTKEMAYLNTDEIIELIEEGGVVNVSV